MPVPETHECGHPEPSERNYLLKTDGSGAGTVDDPGQGGIGVVLMNPDGGVIEKISESMKRLATSVNATISASPTEQDDGQPLKLVSRRERATVIHSQLQEMPEHMRMVTILIIMEGLTQKDAASILKCSESSVSRHLEAARNWLRPKLRCLI